MTVKKTSSSDEILTQSNVSSAKEVAVRGMASTENTLNTMSGDITYEELLSIPGISTLALRAKEKSGNISIFQKKDYASPLSQKDIQVSYYNVALLKRFVSESGKIVPSRISNLPRDKQKIITSSIKRARFLAFFSAVQY